MYGLAYAILPSGSSPLQDALDEALVPFRRGGIDEFPREKLTFNDATGRLRKLHGEPFRLKLGDGGGIVVDGNDRGFDLDIDGIRELVQVVDAEGWSGRLADVEPDFDAFVRRFTRWKERDPLTGGYGMWSNALGSAVERGPPRWGYGGPLRADWKGEDLRAGRS